MTVYETFQQLPIDHGVIGLIQREDAVAYFCTPENARILGWAGVDGIHYCTIPEFGEMVFAVSPMNIGDYVHPIAQDFSQLLRMLLFCGDLAALEQCYAWGEEQFKAFLMDCPITREQRAVLDVIREAFCLEPMEDTFARVKALQREFDLSQIPYTEDYYDADMNPAVPVSPGEWKVSFDGGFWSNDGEPGQEIFVGRHFLWGSERWQIPAVYLCQQGLVVDYCLEAAPEQMQAYIDKWDLYNEASNHYTHAQREQMERENPVHGDFYGRLTCNGKALENGSSCGITWLPDSCLPEGTRCQPEAEAILTHYGLDPSRAWSFRRWSYPWNGAGQEPLQGLTLRMERCPEAFSGATFVAPEPGTSIPLVHPATGESHVLTVHSLQWQELPERVWNEPHMEYPRQFLTMGYTLEPDIHSRGFLVRDCAEGDQPRRKQQAPGAPETTCAASFGIIGGADGPTAVFVGGSAPRQHAACSALYFEPMEQVGWQPVFYEKMLEDVTIRLL